MTILLSVFFYGMLLANISSYFKGLFKRAKISSIMAASMKPDEKLVALGCASVTIPVLLILFTFPMTYLQWHGLEALGLSGWWAIVLLVTQLISMGAAAFKNESVSQAIPLSVLNLLIAYQGLIALGGYGFGGHA